jgi:DNA-binding transcriptional ArsR family regulator
MVESCLDSVWSLELLLLLHLQPDRRWATPELVTELRSSELVVSQSISCLLNAGLLIDERDGTVRYASVSTDLAAFVEKLAHEYRTRPNQIRRMIVSRSNTKLTSFSDAFLLRRPPQ